MAHLVLLLHTARHGILQVVPFGAKKTLPSLMQHDLFTSLEDLDHVCMRLQFDWDPISRRKANEGWDRIEAIGSKEEDEVIAIEDLRVTRKASWIHHVLDDRVVSFVHPARYTTIAAGGFGGSRAECSRRRARRPA